jgi:PKD repeat protein
MSLSGVVSDSLDLAVTNSIAAGVTYAVAAGNGDSSFQAQDACNYSPARVPAAITVSATDRTDTKPSFANYGPCVDLFAPGVSITSSWNTSDTAAYTLSGTSMSTAHVTGAAALFLAGDPVATPQTVRDAIVAASTKGIVLASSTGNNHLLYALDFGTLGPPPNMPPVASFTALSTGLTVAFTDTSTDSDGAIQFWAWNFGDGNTANVPSPTHTYAAGSTYTVTLTVTDDAGAAASSTRPIAVSVPSTAILLGVTGRAVKNKTYADLAWSGAPGASIDVYRNGSLITTTPNDGQFTDVLGKLRGTMTYKVCVSGTATCSNEVKITF